jgi:hypothetical protein
MVLPQSISPLEVLFANWVVIVITVRHFNGWSPCTDHPYIPLQRERGEQLFGLTSKICWDKSFGRRDIDIRNQQIRQAPPVESGRNSRAKNYLRLCKGLSGISSQSVSSASSLGSSCQDASAQRAGVGGEGPGGLKKIYESLSIGFQVNRAIRINYQRSVGFLVVRFEWNLVRYLLGVSG